MKIIDLLKKIANGEEVPKKIKWGDNEYYLRFHEDKIYYFYFNNKYQSSLIEDLCNVSDLNDEVEILDEEDKDIPLIPDDELIILKQEKAIDMQKAIDFNFKVLQEKINQVAEELNRRSNEEKSSNKD